MNACCCLVENHLLLLGVPSSLTWTITGKPCDTGTVLTLQVDGARTVQLFGGNPVNLQEQVIEVKDTNAAYLDIIGPTEYLDIDHLADDLTYLEVARCCEDTNSDKSISVGRTDAVASSVPKQEFRRDGNLFYKWSKILRYLDDHLGKVAVEAWFDQATVTEFTDQLLKIDAGNAFRSAIIHRRCLNLIQDALWELYGSKAVVEVFSSVE